MKLCGLLLAAGAGRRFGADKLSHPVEGVAMAVRSWRLLAETELESLAVVRAADEGASLLLAGEGARLIENARADEGLSTSLLAGLAALSAAQGVLVMLADMPFVRAATLSALIAAFRPGDFALAPTYADQWGNPVILGPDAIVASAGLSGDRGARPILEARRAEVRLVPVDDPGVLRDVDRLQDL
jgi:molybdenum cofactor cytidylyltransferase